MIDAQLSQLDFSIVAIHFHQLQIKNNYVNYWNENSIESMQWENTRPTCLGIFGMWN